MAARRWMPRAKCATEILNAAARLMGAAPDELILYDGGVTHSRAERRMTYGEIVRANGATV